jgi:UDP-N-acetylmuramoyl-tripeptide--D-alanyl-D-alanine ligase
MIDRTKDVVFLNQDDSYVKQMDDVTVADVLWYSIDDLAAGDVGCRDFVLRKDDSGLPASEMTCFAHGKERSLQTNMVSSAYAAYIAIGWTMTDIVAHRQDISLDDVTKVSYEMQPGRCSFLAGKEGSIILDSSYNASPKSMRHMLGLAYRLKHDVFQDRKLIGIIGEMRELGDFSEQEHRLLAGVLSQVLDQILLIGHDVQHTMDELQKVGYDMSRVAHFFSSRAAGQYVLDMMQHDEWK